MKLTRKIYHLAAGRFPRAHAPLQLSYCAGPGRFTGLLRLHRDASLILGDYRGVLNSAWIGAQMTLVLTVFLSLFGFYLVKNSIERDTQTGVGQIIATTPISRPAYLTGKWLSHFCCWRDGRHPGRGGAGYAAVRQRGCPGPLALLAPFLLVALPCMGFIAGLTVLFESIPFLRGGLGNVIYFFLWIAIVTGAFWSTSDAGLTRRAPTEPFGLGVFIPAWPARSKPSTPITPPGWATGT